MTGVTDRMVPVGRWESGGDDAKLYSSVPYTGLVLTYRIAESDYIPGMTCSFALSLQCSLFLSVGAYFVYP